MSLAEESEAYQAMLETARTHPDDEDVQEDLVKARCALELAWLEATCPLVTEVRRIDRSFLDLEDYDDVRLVDPKDDENPDIARPGQWEHP